MGVRRRSRRVVQLSRACVITRRVLVIPHRTVLSLLMVSLPPETKISPSSSSSSFAGHARVVIEDASSTVVSTPPRGTIFTRSRALATSSQTAALYDLLDSETRGRSEEGRDKKMYKIKFSFATENLWANPHVQNPERSGHCTDLSKPVGSQRTIFAVTCFPLKTGKAQEKPNKYHHRRLFYKETAGSAAIPPTNTSGKKVSVVYCCVL